MSKEKLKINVKEVMAENSDTTDVKKSLEPSESCQGIYEKAHAKAEAIVKELAEEEAYDKELEKVEEAPAESSKLEDPQMPEAEETELQARGFEAMKKLSFSGKAKIKSLLKTLKGIWQEIRSDKKKLIAFIIAIVLLLSAGGYFIYRNVSGEKIVIEAEDNPVVEFYELFEPIDGTDNEQDYSIIVKNRDKENEYYVRMKINTTLEDDEEEKWIKEHLDEAWELGDDGYVYHIDKLESGEKTTSALVGVKVDDSLEVLGTDAIVYISDSGYVKAKAFTTVTEAFSQ